MLKTFNMAIPTKAILARTIPDIGAFTSVRWKRSSEVEAGVGGGSGGRRRRRGSEAEAGVGGGGRRRRRGSEAEAGVGGGGGGRKRRRGSEDYNFRRATVGESGL